MHDEQIKFQNYFPREKDPKFGNLEELILKKVHEIEINYEKKLNNLIAGFI